MHLANLLRTDTGPVKRAMVSGLFVDAEAKQVAAHPDRCRETIFEFDPMQKSGTVAAGHVAAKV
jgi:hypothetical protein